MPRPIRRVERCENLCKTASAYKLPTRGQSLAKRQKRGYTSGLLDRPLHDRLVFPHMESPDFTYSGTELDSMAGARNYYRMLVGRLAPYVGRRSVEVGAGIGTFTEYLLAGTDAQSVHLIEPDTVNIRRLEARFAGAPRVRVTKGFLETSSEPRSYDSVIAVNVLEHVQDDAAFLRAAHNALDEGGHLLLYVPAIPGIYGSLDRAFGHFRRYTRKGLELALREAGFEVTDLRSTNLPGIVAWFVAGRVLRKQTLPRRDVEQYDRWVVPWLERLEAVWSPPVGQNIFAVARRKDLP